MLAMSWDIPRLQLHSNLIFHPEPVTQTDPPSRRVQGGDYERFCKVERSVSAAYRC
jgi:hypothetical protein